MPRQEITWLSPCRVTTPDHIGGGTPPASEQHFKESGHCLETKGAGTDVLVLLSLHFN